MLCGCASAKKDSAIPATVERKVPTQTCERILREVPLPAITADDDARTAFLKDDAALISANGRITAGRDCVADVRKKYASPE